MISSKQWQVVVTDHPDVSILIPVLNETATVELAIQEVLDNTPPYIILELIAIDGGSTDGSWQQLQEALRRGHLHQLIRQKAWGKGGAVIEGAAEAHGKVVAIFDADLEYDAVDIFTVAEPVIQGDADIGLGVRLRNSIGMRRPLLFPSAFEGFFLDIGTFCLEALILMLTGAPFRDPFCMHRCWRSELTPLLPGGTPGFGWDLDMLLTAQMNNWRILQTPVAYHPRSFGAGKKLRPLRDSMDNLRVANRHRIERKRLLEASYRST